MKAECDEVEGRIHHRTDNVTKARSRFAALKQTHAALRRRLASATAAKLAILDRERGRSAAQAPAPGPPQPSAAGTLLGAAQHGPSVAWAGTGNTRHAGADKLQQMNSKNRAISLVCGVSGGGCGGPAAPTRTIPSLSGAAGTPTTPSLHAWCPPSTQHAPSASLFCAPAMAPPPLATFRHHAAISYVDLVKASGSATRVIDFSGTTSGELLSRCMAQRVARLGCGAGEVAWFVQMDCEAAPGLPLSYSCTLSTPHCVASLAMFVMVLYLETALISTALGLPGFTEDEVERSLAQHAPSTAKRACRHEPPHPATGSHLPADAGVSCMCGADSATTAVQPTLTMPNTRSQCGLEACDSPDGKHMHVFSDDETSLSPGPELDPHAWRHLLPQRSFCSDQEDDHSCGRQPATQAATPPMARAPHACAAVRCGVRQLCCSRVAARRIVQTLYERYRGRMPRAVLHKLVGASRQQVATTLDSFLSQGPLDTSADTGRPSAASLDSASTGHSADASSHSGGSPTAGCAPEAGEPEAAAGSGRSREVPEGSAAAEFHYSLAVTVIGMLQNLCRALEEVLEDGDEQQCGPTAQPARPLAQGDAWVPAGCRGHGAGPASGINGEPGGSGRCLGRIDRRGQQELEERVYETLSSLSIGCMLAQRHAPRIFWSLSASAVFPRASYPDVEELHVKLYRLLRLSEQQKDLYAANWQLWEQRRTAYDEHTSATLQQLRRLPQTLNMSLSFMRHLTAIAAGTLPGGMDLDLDDTVVVERSPRVLGARGGDAAAAAAAVRALWTMHEADVMLIAETIDLQIQPGALLEPPQVAQSFGVHLLHGGTPIDFMSICRLAATECRRGRLDGGRAPDTCLRIAAGAPALPTIDFAAGCGSRARGTAASALADPCTFA